MPTIEREGRKVHYLDVGSGPVFLLMHAFPVHAGAFESLAGALKGRYRVLLPDAPGFGGSTLGDSTTQMTTIAEDALAILDHVGAEQAVVGGVSMGGYASLALAREMPSRVRALVLMDTQAGADDEDAKHNRMQLIRAVENEGVKALIERQLPKLLANPASKPFVEKMIREADPKAAIAAIRGLAEREDSRGILARFSGPVLILVGEKDVPTPPEKAKAMQELAAGSKLVEIPNAGHLAHIDAPDLVNQAVKEFGDCLA